MRVALGPDRAEASPPKVCLLSNGRYSVVLTQSGSGFSSRDGMDVTRWREDGTSDGWGQYCYVRNVDDRRAWSAAASPSGETRTIRCDLRPRPGDLPPSRRRGRNLYEIAVVPDATRKSVESQ